MHCQGRACGCQSSSETPHEAGLLSRGACPQPRCPGPFQTPVPDTAQPALRRRKSPRAQGRCSSLCFVWNLLINPPCSDS